MNSMFENYTHLKGLTAKFYNNSSVLTKHFADDIAFDEAKETCIRMAIKF